MFCFNCGSHATPGQKFCRTCGANLSAMLENDSISPATPTVSSQRLQILVDALTDAVQTGVQHIKSPSLTTSDGNLHTNRYRQWGLMAFWAGVAALLGVKMGIILILVGIGMMAYARGLFGSVKKAATTGSINDYVSPSRDPLPRENRRVDEWEKMG